MLLADDVLLLLTEDETGKLRSRWPDLVLAGALLSDLALAGNVRLTENGETLRRNRLVCVPDAPWPADPMLADALTTLGRKERWYPASAVDRISSGKLQDAVYRRLAQAELVSRSDHRVLGLIPTTRWVALDPRHEDSLRAQLDEVFLFGTAPGPHIAALAALLAASGSLFAVLDRGRKLDRARLKRIGKELLAEYWTAQATERAMSNRDGAAVG